MNCMASVTNLIIVTDCCIVHMLLCLHMHATSCMVPGF